MKESRIYTLSMCRYLTDLGFKYVRVCQDIKNPEFLNWFFEDTPELHQAIHDYIKNKQ